MQKSQPQQNLPPISISLRASPSVSVLTTTTHSTLSHTSKPGVLATKLPLDPSYNLEHRSLMSSTRSSSVQSYYPSSASSSSSRSPSSSLPPNYILPSSNNKSSSLRATPPPSLSFPPPLQPTFPTVAKQQLLKTRTLPSSHYAKFPFQPLSTPVFDLPNNFPTYQEYQKFKNSPEKNYSSSSEQSIVIESRSIVVKKGTAHGGTWDFDPDLDANMKYNVNEKSFSSPASIYETEVDLEPKTDNFPIMENIVWEETKTTENSPWGVGHGGAESKSMGYQQEGSNPFKMADKDNEDERKRMEDESLMIMKMIREQKEKREREERERIEKERRAAEYAEAQRLFEERQKLREEKERQREEEKLRLKNERVQTHQKRKEQILQKIKAFEENVQERLEAWVEKEREAQEHAPNLNWLSTHEFAGLSF